MNMKRIAGVMFAALLLAGCGGSSSSTAPTLLTAPTSAQAVAFEGLTATLSEPSAQVSAGIEVTYTLTLANNTAQSVAVLANGVIADPTPATSEVPVALFVKDVQGNTVYPGEQPNVAPPPMPGYGSVTVTLQPGQAITQQIAVSTVLTRGAYYATADFDVLLPSAPDVAHNTEVGPLAIVVR